MLNIYTHLVMPGSDDSIFWSFRLDDRPAITFLPYLGQETGSITKLTRSNEWLRQGKK